MKIIVLISPRSFDDRVSPPLGLGLIASYVEMKQRFHVKIIDLNIITDHDLFIYLSKNISDVVYVGISTVSMTFLNVINLAISIKYSFPKVVIVLGGPYPSFAYKEILSNYMCVDYIIVGEGEQSTLDLAEAIINNNDVTMVNGIAWRTSSGVPKINNISETKDAEYNNVPLNYSLFDYKDYIEKNDGKKRIYLLTSRGCPFNCSFCSNYNYSKIFCSGFRYRPIEAVKQELLNARKNCESIQEIVIHDNDFLINPKHAKLILSMILKYYGEIQIKFCTRVDSLLKSKELLKCNSQIFDIEVGIESFVDSQLIRFNKRIATSNIEEAFCFLNKAKINYSVDMLYFEPFVTIEELRINFRKIIEHRLCEKCEYSLFLRCYLYPGTQMTKEAYISGLSTGETFCDNWTFLSERADRVWRYLQLFKYSEYEKLKKLRKQINRLLYSCTNQAQIARLLLLRYKTYEFLFLYAEELTQCVNENECKMVIKKYEELYFNTLDEKLNFLLASGSKNQSYI